MTDPIIRTVTAADCACRNDHPHLDEFVAANVTIHFEQMGDAQFWIGVNDKNGRMWHINCGAVSTRVKGYSRVEEDTP